MALAFVLGILGVGIGLIVARGVPTWTGILVLAAPVVRLHREVPSASRC